MADERCNLDGLVGLWAVSHSQDDAPVRVVGWVEPYHVIVLHGDGGIEQRLYSRPYRYLTTEQVTQWVVDCLNRSNGG